MIYIDTNIFIYLFEQHPDFGEKVVQTIDALRENNQLICSALTVTECLAQVTEVTLDTFLAMPGLHMAILDANLAAEAGHLQRETHLRIGDAIHLATAVQYKAELFFTNDKQLAKIAAKYLAVKTL